MKKTVTQNQNQVMREKFNNNNLNNKLITKF